MEEPLLPFASSPVCAVKQRQMQTVVQFGRRGPEQTTARSSILLSSSGCYSKGLCALFLVLNRSWGNPVTGRHTLHSGDCGWHRSEISIASTVQAVSLQRPSWTTGLLCLCKSLPSYDLIWLNIWLREEDWPPTSARNIVSPIIVFCVFALVEPSPRSEWRGVFPVLKLYSIVTWYLLQHGNKVWTSQIVFPFWHTWKESTLRTPPLPKVLPSDLFVSLMPSHKLNPFTQEKGFPVATAILPS